MKAELLIATDDAAMRHRTGLHAPDPFVYLKTDTGAEHVFFSVIEYEAQKKKLPAQKSHIVFKAIEPYYEKAAARTEVCSGFAKVVLALLDEHSVQEVTVDRALACEYVRALESAGVSVTIKDFALERTQKSAYEIEHIIAVQKHVDEAFASAKEILEQSSIADGFLEYEGSPLTSERMKYLLQAELLKHDITCPHGIIAASGEQTAHAHDHGSGPLAAHAPIIIDIFPRNTESGYFSDMTRTFCKGEPSDALVRMYDTVKKAQEHAVAQVRVGATYRDIHQGVVAVFEEEGFITSKNEGFVHSTGHSLGLELHESPSVSSKSEAVVEAGHVITIEPGLYYEGVGGVRIEDMVVVHLDGTPENITKFEKELIVM